MLHWIQKFSTVGSIKDLEKHFRCGFHQRYASQRIRASNAGQNRDSHREDWKRQLVLGAVQVRTRYRN